MLDAPVAVKVWIVFKLKLLKEMIMRILLKSNNNDKN